MKANLLINGKEYSLYFGMADIANVIEDIGAGIDVTKASQIMKEAGNSPVMAVKISAICGFNGIKGWHRKNKIECPFATLEEFEDEISNVDEISGCIESFTTAFVEFYKLGDQKGSKKKGAATH